MRRGRPSRPSSADVGQVLASFGPHPRLAEGSGTPEPSGPFGLRPPARDSSRRARSEGPILLIVAEFHRRHGQHIGHTKVWDNASPWGLLQHVAEETQVHQYVPGRLSEGARPSYCVSGVRTIGKAQNQTIWRSTVAVPIYCGRQLRGQFWQSTLAVNSEAHLYVAAGRPEQNPRRLRVDRRS